MNGPKGGSGGGRAANGSAVAAAENAFENEGGASRSEPVSSSRSGSPASLEHLLVRDFMSSNVAPVREDSTLVAAAQQMRISGVGGVPVLDREGKRCVGILTERDVVVRILAEERDPRAAVVRDAATLDPVVCTPDDEVATALAQMRKARIQHLPVVARGRIVGVISLADVVFGRPDEERGTIVLPPVRSR